MKTMFGKLSLEFSNSVGHVPTNLLRIIDNGRNSKSTHYGDGAYTDEAAHRLAENFYGTTVSHHYVRIELSCCGDLIPQALIE